VVSPSFVTPQIAHRDSPALTFLDYLGYIAPGGGFSSVDRQDTVTRLQTCLFSRRTTLHIAYVGRGGRNADHVQSGQEEYGEKKVEQRPRRNYADALQYVLLQKGAPFVFRGDDIVFRFPEQLDVASQRYQRNHVFRLAHLLPDEPFAEAERKFQDPDPEHLCRQEVAEFMDEYKDAQENGD